MKKLMLSLAATFFVIREDGVPMTISGLSQEEIEKQEIYEIVDKTEYEEIVAAQPAPGIEDQGPTIEDRLAALETAVTAVAIKTATPIDLPAKKETP